jgi:hypothetical protein
MVQHGTKLMHRIFIFTSEKERDEERRIRERSALELS